MDDLQQRFAELIWQQPPELLDDLPRIKALLSDHLPHHPAYRRALVTAVECGVARAVTECTAEHLPLSRPRFLNRLCTEGFEELTSSWSVDALVLILGTGFDPELCFQMGRRLAPEALLGQLETSESEQTKLYKAVCCFRRAADKGHLEASLWLGEMLRLGKGVERDERQGAQWIMRAAEGENATAQCILGRAYLQGIGVERDRAQALAWFTKSAKQGDSNALVSQADMLLEDFHASRSVGAAARTHTQYNQQRRLLKQALESLEIAALAGNSSAASQLGDIYSGTRNDCRNFSKALRWYEVAAQASSGNSLSGSAFAMYRLFQMYTNGNADGMSAQVAVDRCRRSAELGYQDAQLTLAETLYHGIRMSNGETLRWYRTGKPITDEAEAILWYCTAVENGHPDSKKTLESVIRDAVEYGRGDELREWLRVASKEGRESAKRGLKLADELIAAADDEGELDQE